MFPGLDPAGMEDEELVERSVDADWYEEQRMKMMEIAVNRAIGTAFGGKKQS